MWRFSLFCFISPKLKKLFNILSLILLHSSNLKLIQHFFIDTHLFLWTVFLKVELCFRFIMHRGEFPLIELMRQSVWVSFLLLENALVMDLRLIELILCFEIHVPSLLIVCLLLGGLTSPIQLANVEPLNEFTTDFFDKWILSDFRQFIKCVCKLSSRKFQVVLAYQKHLNWSGLLVRSKVDPFLCVVLVN